MWHSAAGVARRTVRTGEVARSVGTSSTRVTDRSFESAFVDFDFTLRTSISSTSAVTDIRSRTAAAVKTRLRTDTIGTARTSPTNGFGAVTDIRAYTFATVSAYGIASRDGAQVSGVVDFGAVTSIRAIASTVVGTRRIAFRDSTVLTGPTSRTSASFRSNTSSRSATNRFVAFSYENEYSFWKLERNLRV